MPQRGSRKGSGDVELTAYTLTTLFAFAQASQPFEANFHPLQPRASSAKGKENLNNSMTNVVKSLSLIGKREGLSSGA